MELSQIRAIAKKNGWKEIDLQQNISMISFSKDDKRINVYYSKMTVATALLHPVKGKTQLYRRNVWDIKKLENIFMNPRVHTGRGYYTK